MTIKELLKEKWISKYKLLKTGGIDWATLSDICSGKTSIYQYNAGTN